MGESVNEQIGQRLKFVRILNCLSQGEMAKEIGTTQANYSLIEAGKVALAEKHAKKIGDRLAINFEWFLKGNVVSVTKGNIFSHALPPQRIFLLSPIYQSRKRNELQNSARAIFTTFFRENLDGRKYFITQAPSVRTFVASKLRHGSFLLLELVEQKIAEEIIKAFEDLGLDRLEKKIEDEVLKEISNFKPSAMINLLKMFDSTIP